MILKNGKADIMKTCTNCGETKILDNFYNSKKGKNGKSAHCKACDGKKHKAFRKKRKDHLREYYRKWRSNNEEHVKEYGKKYYLKDLESNRAKRRAYQKLNIASAVARARQYELSKLNATPPWLSEEQKAEMQQFYWLAKDLYAVTGEVYQVDHIVPIQGENVCGLHVPWNLQVLPRDVNIRKSNKLEHKERCCFGTER